MEQNLLAEEINESSGDEPGVFKAYPNPNLLRTEFGWEIDPDGFRATMREIYSRYHLPMIVTENGLGAYDKLTEDGKVHDQYRIEYLRKHIEQTACMFRRCRNDGLLSVVSD